MYMFSGAKRRKKLAEKVLNTFSTFSDKKINSYDTIHLPGELNEYLSIHGDVNYDGGKDDKLTIFMYTCMFAKRLKLEKLVPDCIRRGAKLDLQTRNSYTALHLILDNFRTSSIDVLKSLLDSGANLNIQNYNTNNPLLNACKMGKYEAAIAIIDAGANLDIQNGSGETPLIKF